MKYFFLVFLLFRTVLLPCEILNLGRQDRCYISENSVYEWSDNELLPGQGFFSYFSENNSPFLPELIYPLQADQGDMITIQIFIKEDLEQVQAELRDADGNRILYAEGFIAGRLQDIRAWVLLIGIPSFLKSGTYLLLVSGKDDLRQFQELKYIEVISKEFLFEEIALNKGLTGLMTEKSDKRIEESRRLYEIITAFNPDAIFYTGNFILPVMESRRTAYFGDRRKYVYANGKSSLSVHNGIDLAAPAGTSISACGSGRVVFAGYRIITGNTVVLEHLPGVYSLYYHLKDMNVVSDQMIKRGHRIGSVGATGLATGSHLHWELRVSGEAVDPEQFIQKKLIDKNGCFSMMRKLNQTQRR